MPSQFRSILANLSGWQFTIASEVVTSPLALQLEDMPFSGLMPYRIISPALNRAEGKVMASTFGMGSYDIKWTVDDLLLWRTQLEVPSFSDVVSPLMDYMAAYAQKWVVNRQITPQAFIESIETFTAGVFKYPAGTETAYYGVLATLVIKENVDA